MDRAALWCEVNLVRRKTSRGMPRFLAGWLARAKPPQDDSLSADGIPMSELERMDRASRELYRDTTPAEDEHFRELRKWRAKEREIQRAAEERAAAERAAANFNAGSDDATRL
jgi:hypothetical protein